MVLKTTFICPYCFEKHKLSEVQFRCTNRRCKDYDDLEMTKYEDGNLKMPKQGKKTFTVSTTKVFSIANSAKCPDCGNTTYKHICPSCHNELPDSTLTGNDMIISVVGSLAAGKSHFIGVLIKELKDRISVSFGGSLEGFSDSYQRWEHRYGDKLYFYESLLPWCWRDTIKPLVFNFKVKRETLFGFKESQFTLVFFDMDTVGLCDEDTISMYNKYICNSSGIIFLLDPLRIPAVVAQLDDSVVKRAAGIDWRQAAKADDSMARVSNLIRNDKGMSAKQKIDIPVAAVFSKFDAIESIVPQDCAVHNPSPHCVEKRFNLSDWNNVNSEIVALLYEWGAEAFISQLETNYRNYSYFIVSALGLNNNPTIDGRIEKPRPHRIEDPVLWILKENGVIK